MHKSIIISLSIPQTVYTLFSPDTSLSCIHFPVIKLKAWHNYMFKDTLTPSAHSTTFIAGKRDLVFCLQRRKRISSILDTEDSRQRQTSFICVSCTQQVLVASDENRAVSARLT